MVNIQCRKVQNWKAAGSDGVQGFLLKKFTSLHDKILVELNDIKLCETNTKLDALREDCSMFEGPGKRESCTRMFGIAENVTEFIRSMAIWKTQLSPAGEMNIKKL